MSGRNCTELPWEATLGWLPQLGLWDEPLLCLCLLCRWSLPSEPFYNSRTGVSPEFC